MPFWLQPTVADEPDATLTSWAAYEVQIPGLDGPTLHVAGRAARDGSGRVTSPVHKVDAAHRCVVTRSGRVYRLGRGRGLTSDAEYVWRQWLGLNEATVLREATASLLEQFAAAAQQNAGPLGE